ncbi:hypothetical protein BDZ89DRAFT_1071401, partial [Hymenopellis radicata]
MVRCDAAIGTYENKQPTVEEDERSPTRYRRGHVTRDQKYASSFPSSRQLKGVSYEAATAIDERIRVEEDKEVRYVGEFETGESQSTKTKSDTLHTHSRCP